MMSKNMFSEDTVTQSHDLRHQLTGSQRLLGKKCVFFSDNIAVVAHKLYERRQLVCKQPPTTL